MEIEECKQISILDVANRLGISFKQVSNRVYEHPEHDSFRIFSTTNTFKWFSRDIQGDVIDFVRLVKGISFKEALAFLSDEPFQKEAVQEKRERPFYYPLKRTEDSNCSLARYYLTECRGNFRRNHTKDDSTRFDVTSQFGKQMKLLNLLLF